MNSEIAMKFLQIKDYIIPLEMLTVQQTVGERQMKHQAPKYHVLLTVE